MTRSLITLCAAAVLLGACDKIQLPSAVPAKPAVAVIDMAAVAKALGRDEVAKQQLEAANQQLRQQLTDVSAGLQEKLREEQSKLGEAPTPEDQQKLKRLAAEAQRQLQQSQAVARQRSVQFQNQLAGKFRAEVQPVAAEVASRHGASTVLMANTLLWFEPAVDITGAVIDALRAKGASMGAPATGAGAGEGEAGSKTQ